MIMFSTRGVVVFHYFGACLMSLCCCQLLEITEAYGIVKVSPANYSAFQTSRIEDPGLFVPAVHMTIAEDKKVDREALAQYVKNVNCIVESPDSGLVMTKPLKYVPSQR
ncbi:hypothetical protein SARC_16999 [Sphaeroforma arctica JP610]|uniref:Uncharacterized protein n=1 Tax=Sphaeroforma arctica JP610 TaxID=667725 RepID=A0A0L0F1D5_9EUKA|nr:hypothetical protein SARC_16999 [Sphaeroforma arctica JP610]KNC70471.1 hypothetical protein SARC_16999 [Sphaeroforma arctica JP610]|eukprot:XP_014144373.1 hypothetical protein SARC_16999 [Sphaeroforma arctica JP610]